MRKPQTSLGAWRLGVLYLHYCNGVDRLRLDPVFDLEIFGKTDYCST